MSRQLTLRHRQRLEEIHEVSKDPHFRAAGYFGGLMDKWLEKEGFVKIFVEEKPLGGGGAIGKAMVKWHLIRLTDKGHEAIRRAL